VNPELHDEFVALCALFASGELTEEEWALLQVHLAYCDSCSAVFEQYQQLAAELVPLMAASAASELEGKSAPSSFSVETAERRLVNQLDSTRRGQHVPPRRMMGWQLSAGLLAASILGAVLIGLHFIPSTRTNTTRTVAVTDQPAYKPAVPAKPEASPSATVKPTQREAPNLQVELSAAQDRYRRSDLAAAEMEQKLAAEEAERNRISSERDALSQQLVAAQAEVQSLRDKSATVGTTAAQQAERAAALEAQVHTLNAALEDKDRMLALDKQFLDHDREIRDLIAARNLYIADIYDVAQNGKTAKPFGRIFYTKDKSLVFYGYDLDKQAGLNQRVAFQAWGSSGDDKQNVSLGLFYQDDTHKRWVLRFNDTKTLARLNMVFVTAEPEGGSAKPTGKPLLMAYLQVQPNHP
jgi:hypothetical protein